MKAYTKSWLDPIGLYVVFVLVALILEQLDVLGHLLTLILVCIATPAMLIANGRERPGLYTKLWRTEGERDEAQMKVRTVTGSLEAVQRERLRVERELRGLQAGRKT